MHCYITDTGSFLPGEPISNNDISRYIGTLENEEETRAHILKMNGIQTRHYALDQNQSATHDLYDLGTIAAKDCLQHNAETISYLSAGSTNTPLIAPGISSILHDRLTKKNLLTNSLEINSNSGVCTASAQSLVNAIRTVKSGEHKHALCLGVEQPSAILKSSVINPPNDRASSADIRMTKWFMSVFLRSMLSDGAGAMLLGHKPKQQGTSFKVNWTYSRSFANEAPLCMKLESPSLLLSQNVSILSKYMKPFILSVFEEAFKQHEDDLSSYSHILPHLSSFLFKRYIQSVFKKFSSSKDVNCWTNLKEKGNTGAASIYIMLDEFKKTQPIEDGEKVLLFIPESGQFNYVLISLTVFK